MTRSLPDRQPVRVNRAIEGVRYEIRGALAARAIELEHQGFEILSLNIGNPGLFGYRTPESLRLAMIENLHQAEAYCHQKGIFPAREAVVMQQQTRGVILNHLNGNLNFVFILFIEIVIERTDGDSEVDAT